MMGVLTQLAVVIGGLVFLVVVGSGVAYDVPILTAVFRGLVAMGIVTMTVAFCLRGFTVLLYRFVAERVLQQKAKVPERPGLSSRKPPERPATE